jgi:hypothetical protein
MIGSKKHQKHFTFWIMTLSCFAVFPPTSQPSIDLKSILPFYHLSSLPLHLCLYLFIYVSFYLCFYILRSTFFVFRSSFFVLRSSCPKPKIFLHSSFFLFYHLSTSLLVNITRRYHSSPHCTGRWRRITDGTHQPYFKWRTINKLSHKRVYKKTGFRFASCLFLYLFAFVFASCPVLCQKVSQGYTKA